MHRGILLFMVGALGAVILLLPAGSLQAATNVTSTVPNYFAWNDTAGWIDFFGTNSVNVLGTRLTGYASSSIGDVSLDCATTRNGNICISQSNYGVCNGPGPHNTDGTCPNGDGGDTTGGALTGYAWNDTIGWISMNCDQSSYAGDLNRCGTSNYKVSIDSNGNFTGWAWNDTVGWINFNCGSTGSTCPPNYKVSSDWRSTSSVGIVESSILDTQTTSVLNSIIWQGTLPNGTCVDFQVATSSNPGGPWAYVGPNGSASQFFGASCGASFVGGPGCASPNTAICITPGLVQNSRYLRYKVRLMSDRIQVSTPEVDSVILNWSR